MLQALVLPHKFAVFDEIDTGLDVDALRAVSKGLAYFARRAWGAHYYALSADSPVCETRCRSCLVAGKIVDTGDHTLAKR